MMFVYHAFSEGIRPLTVSISIEGHPPVIEENNSAVGE